MIEQILSTITTKAGDPAVILAICVVALIIAAIVRMKTTGKVHTYASYTCIACVTAAALTLLFIGDVQEITGNAAADISDSHGKTGLLITILMVAATGGVLTYAAEPYYMKSRYWAGIAMQKYVWKRKEPKDHGIEVIAPDSARQDKDGPSETNNARQAGPQEGQQAIPHRLPDGNTQETTEVNSASTETSTVAIKEATDTNKPTKTDKEDGDTQENTQAKITAPEIIAQGENLPDGGDAEDEPEEPAQEPVSLPAIDLKKIFGTEDPLRIAEKILGGHNHNQNKLKRK